MNYLKTLAKGERGMKTGQELSGTNMGMSRLFGSDNPQHRAYPTSATHNFHIYGPIEELPSYVDMITVLTTATEHDIIHIFLNTPGGEINTTISIIHAMMRCQGTVVTHADGEVASAGTLIFLAAPMRIVYPYSHFMFHDASGGAFGKINENMKRIHATTELIENLAMDIYQPTFSEEEVIEILEGRDYYCDAEEMVDRINAANDRLEEELRESLEESQEEQDESEEVTVDLYEVDNKNLKSHGQIGIVVDTLEGGRLVVLELESGKEITIKRSNIKKLSEVD